MTLVGAKGLPRKTGRDPSETVFIVGPARSGTSLLYKVLCLHPDVAFISNWRSRFPSVPALAAFNRVARRFPSRQRRAWFGPDANAYVYGRPRALRDRLFPSPVEGEPVYRRAGISRPGGLDPAGVDPVIALRGAFDSLRSLGGGSCVVSKRIANNLRIRQLGHVFPDATFVVLVRDGRAVADSLSQVDWWESSFVWWYGGSPSSWRADGGDPWEMCARNWVEELVAIEEGLRSIPTQQIIELRYEDIVKDPRPIFERLARTLGLPDTRAWRHSLASVPISDRTDRWKERLDPDTVERITAIQHEKLAEYGYAV